MTPEPYFDKEQFMQELTALGERYGVYLEAYSDEPGDPIIVYDTEGSDKCYVVWDKTSHQFVEAWTKN